MTLQDDAIDVVIGLRTGDKFRLRGRVFTIEGYEGWSHYEGYSLVPVWNESNQKVKIRIRETDKIEVLS